MHRYKTSYGFVVVGFCFVSFFPLAWPTLLLWQFFYCCCYYCSLCVLTGRKAHSLVGMILQQQTSVAVLFVVKCLLLLLSSFSHAGVALFL